MRALQATRRGAGAAGLELRSVAEPKPGPDEVLIAVRAVAANHLDRAVMDGRGLARSVALPRTLGIDPSGVVVAVGTEADETLLGGRVVAKPNVFCGACRYCRDGNEADCTDQWTLGVHRDGGAADYVVLPARAVLPIPTGLSHELATATVHSVPVALHLLAKLGPLAGARVLVLGGRGAVGSAAAQLAARSGAHVTAVVRDASAAGRGADVVVTSDGLAGLDPVDAVVDTTGSGALVAAALDRLAWRGVLVTCAASAEPVVGLDLGEFYRRRLTAFGVASADLAEVAAALRLVADGAVQVAPPTQLPLGGYAAAYDAPAGPGKVVFEVRQQ